MELTIKIEKKNSCTQLYFVFRSARPIELMKYLKVVVFGSFDSFLIETVPSPSFIIRFSNFSKCFFIIISSKEVMFLSALVNELVR